MGMEAESMPIVVAGARAVKRSCGEASARSGVVSANAMSALNIIKGTGRNGSKKKSRTAGSSRLQ